jgi:hypothetical protein
MGNLSLIGAVGIGAVVTLAAPVLVWALVATGLRQVAGKNARTEQQPTVEQRKADA